MIRLLSFIHNTNPCIFLTKILAFRAVIRAMAVREIHSRYVGTFAGLSWAVIHPLVMVGIYWLVFSVGFKVRPGGDVPFIVFFVCGLVPWLVFQEILTMSVNAITKSPHLVKKVVFPVEVLPVVSLLVSLATKVVMLVILLAMITVHSLPWSWLFLQSLYYLIALNIFALGLGWLVSSINVFYRDMGHGVTVIVGLWFWLTPVVWPPSMIPDRFEAWMWLNPMYYIVNGYRDTFLYSIPVWDRGFEHLWFWTICLFFFVLGGRIFQRLQPEFAEVL
ncbi:MAG: teichoic acid ABC transporter permease [Opitutales bacterium]|jgi:lipopolysaccharide transport system permease protein/teichoic acid transport system permease protein|nr:teichoic acid ABC transporter permease [Opitutales bacterium]